MQTKAIDKKQALKKMADLMRSGAVMLSEKCPVKGCTMPLFRLKTGEIVCPVHGKIYVVKSDEEARRVMKEIAAKQVLEKLEKNILHLLSEIAENPESHGYREIIGWLEVLERIRRLETGGAAG